MSRPHSDVFPLLSEDLLQQKRASSIPLIIFAVCLTSVVTAVNYTNYGPLIPTLEADLHITSGQAGLMSTFLFLGLAATYIPAGILIDRIGPRYVLIGSCILLTIGGVLLPLYPNLVWMLAWRTVVGFGTGGAFVAGANIASRMGKYAPLAQGLYGGSIQVGSGSGLLITPLFFAWVGWRGSFLIWGLLGILAVIVWLFIHDGQEVHAAHKIDVGAGLRSPSVWALGLSHQGTFGLGNAIAAWIAVYLASQYGLPLALAATLGSIALLMGVFFRPLGGILLARRAIGAIPLLRAGTIVSCTGLLLLVIPLRSPLLVIVGLAAIAIGTTTPYTPVFNEAAKLRTVGKGVAQGLVSIISCPAVIIGPPIIGLIYSSTGNISLAFSSILIFGLIAIAASFLAGPAVRRETGEPIMAPALASGENPAG
ncbi:MAG TPA: MFS transporter [Ktedonobacteraceae bacterium]|nr:MFS transporter [Ktedonobacteraceae bacterium]